VQVTPVNEGESVAASSSSSLSMCYLGYLAAAAVLTCSYARRRAPASLATTASPARPPANCLTSHASQSTLHSLVHGQRAVDIIISKNVQEEQLL